MMAKAEFYLADAGELNPKTGVMKVIPNALHFSLKKPHYADPEKIDTLYDNLARPEHVEAYGPAYSAFMTANPSYKLPWAKEPENEPVSDEPVVAVNEPENEMIE